MVGQFVVLKSSSRFALHEAQDHVRRDQLRYSLHSILLGRDPNIGPMWFVEPLKSSLACGWVRRVASAATFSRYFVKQVSD